MVEPRTAGSKRIAANRLALEIDGVDYWMDASSVVLDNEPADEELMELTDGFAQWFLWFFEVEGIQSTETDSLWRFLFHNVGQLVPFSYAPHGNQEPTPDQPHLVGECRIMHPPRLGGQAQRKGSYEFEMRLEVGSIDRPWGYPVQPQLLEAR